MIGAAVPETSAAARGRSKADVRNWCSRGADGIGDGSASVSLKADVRAVRGAGAAGAGNSVSELVNNGLVKHMRLLPTSR